jgi:hypothetical protein
MAEPSAEQRGEAKRLVDEHADAARADLRKVDEHYTARARLLLTGALEVVIEPPVGRSYLIDREGKIVAEARDRLGASFWIGLGLISVGFTGCSGADKFTGGDTQARDRLFWISGGVAALGVLVCEHAVYKRTD